MSLKQKQGKACAARATKDCSKQPFHNSIRLLGHCSLSKHARDEHTAQLLSLQRHPVVRMQQTNKKRKKKPTSKQSFKRTSLKDVSRAESLHSPFFIFPVQSEVLVFLLCLVAETFLPRYTGKEAAIWHFLPVATNSLSLPSKQLPPIV